MPAESTITAPDAPAARRRALVDVLLVFAVFAFDGAWPVPDVNEAHYVVKAKHFWNSHWIEHDVFLSSADSHVVFFAAFGGLTKFLSLPAAAWVGRVIIWGLQAWGWRRLSFALLPRYGWAAITAAAAVAFTERFHMAGEWFVGGCEAKGVAYAFVFAGFADILTRRWNRGLLLLGGATAFHVLAGGWAIVAAGFAWLLAGRERPPINGWLPGLVGGLVIALPGLWAGAALGRGVDEATVAAANQIYVYERLGHHLDPRFFVPHYGLRHAALWAVWLAACVYVAADGPRRVLRSMTACTGLLMLAGLAIGFGLPRENTLAPALLRYYWFRLADVMVAVGVTFELAALAAATTTATRRLVARCALATVIAAHFGLVIYERASLPATRAENFDDAGRSAAWREVCEWVKLNTPRDALFLTPRNFMTFKWYAERAEVAVWKDVPQDAASLVEWRRRLQELYGDGSQTLNQLPPATIAAFAERYGVSYVVTYRDPPLAFPQAYANNEFVVYSLTTESAAPTASDR